MPGERAVVVVPTYNEAQNLPELVNRLFSLPVATLSLIVIDDNSPDGTGALAEELAKTHPGHIRVLHRTGKLGLGTAYVAGFRTALDEGADVVIQMDADLSHAPEYIPGMLTALEGADVVVGSRYISSGSVEKGWAPGRKLLSVLGNFYARRVLNVPTRDVTSGFKVFRRYVLERLDLSTLRCRGFAFQAEVTYLCHRRGYDVIEYPIHFYERSRGGSKITWQIVWEALWRIPQLRWRRMPSSPQAGRIDHRKTPNTPR